MSLRELYQEVIVDHSQNPRNFGVLERAQYQGNGHNPLCGDRLTVFLNFKDDKVSEIKFQGSGCAISTASASMMSESLLGLTKTQIESLFDKFHKLVTSSLDGGNDSNDSGDLGKLEVFAGVGEFPARVKCATLAWHTVMSAIKGAREVAKTE
ncbi:MAG: SUF system NifU family Fe-S cluster assembly protein [Oligoflexia bacterium]|nr:SUF system NifU family Fe-S cluster assembly protein [Oligoflexia bacterium]